MRTAAIVGAGLAGAACANAFANAGYLVTVYEQAAQLAAGASGVPVALFAPSISADDAPYSRQLRECVHLLIEELNRLSALGFLEQGVDWQLTGAEERCLRGPKNLPQQWRFPQDPCGLQSTVLEDAHGQSPMRLWHPQAGWVLSKRLIEAWLTHPMIECRFEQKMTDLASITVIQADAVVIACGHQTAKLLPDLQKLLQPIRGQVDWGSKPELTSETGVSSIAHFRTSLGSPTNGMGHWIPTPLIWLAGATYQRGEDALQPRAKDSDWNFFKLGQLLPEISTEQLRALRSQSKPWVGVRCAQKNRSPLITQPLPQTQPHIWVCTALGSRGLSLAARCAQVMLESLKISPNCVEAPA